MKRRGGGFCSGAAVCAAVALLALLPGCAKGKCSGAAGKAAVVLVLDYSGSMSSDDVRNAETAARAFIERMTGSDVGKIVKFSSSIYVHPAGGFVAKAELLRLLQTGQNGRGGSTRLYGAMQRGLADLGNQTDHASFRRSLIAFTDGKNNLDPGASAVGTMIADAKAKDVTIFTVGLGDVDRNELEQLAVETGGEFVYAAKSADMQAIYESLADDILECSAARGYLL